MEEVQTLNLTRTRMSEFKSANPVVEIESGRDDDDGERVQINAGFLGVHETQSWLPCRLGLSEDKPHRSRTGRRALKG